MSHESESSPVAGTPSEEGVNEPERSRFYRFAHSRYLKLLTGILLLFTGLSDLAEGVLLDLGFNLEAGHGVAFLGIVIGAQSLAELLEGMQQMTE